MNKSLLKWIEVIPLKVTEELAQCLPDVHSHISENERKVGPVAEGHLSHLDLSRLKRYKKTFYPRFESLQRNHLKDRRQVLRREVSIIWFAEHKSFVGDLMYLRPDCRHLAATWGQLADGYQLTCC